MKKITPEILGLTSFLLASLYPALPAQAENWVEVTTGGREKTFYDSDSAFVDTETGLVVVEAAIWAIGDDDDDYGYVEVAFNCIRDKYYVISTLEDGEWLYFRDIGEEYSSTDPNSYAWTIALWVCDNYYSLPSKPAFFPDRFHFPNN